MYKKMLPLVVSLALLFGLIYFSDIGKVYSIILKTDLYFFGVAVGLWFTTHIIKILRWRYLLRKNSVSLDFSTAFKVFTAGGFVSNILPAKLGEPVKSFLLKTNKGVKVSSTVTSIFFERVFDIAALVAVSLVSMIFLTRSVASIQYWLSISIIIYLVLIVAGFFILSSKKRTLRVMSSLSAIMGFIPRMKGLDQRVDSFVANFYNSFLTYKNKKIYFSVFLMSIAIWVIEGFIMFSIFVALGFEVTVASTMFIVPVATLISVVTLLPGGIGSSEIIIVLFFTSLFGLTAADVTSVAIITRVSTFWISTFVGAFLFSRLKHDYKL